jgi:DNA-binding transcriptional LysR family regulator
MDYRYLKAFLLTAKYSSFSKAASQLSIAQSAVSRQIKLLEESIQEELIIRSSKKIILTEKGNELYELSSELDSKIVSLFEKEDNRCLRIGSLHGLLETWLQPILTSFYDKNSRDISIEVCGQSILLEKLNKGIYDIIFSTENIQSELISSLKIFDEEFILVSKEEINLEDIHKENWIAYSPTDNIFKLSDKKPKSIITVESITSMYNLARQGLGVTVIPKHMHHDNSGLYVLDLPSLSGGSIYLATLNFKKMPGYISDFLDLI